MKNNIVKNITKSFKRLLKISIILRFAEERILKKYFTIFSKENIYKKFGKESSIFMNSIKFEVNFLLECKNGNSILFIQKLCDQNGRMVDYVEEIRVNKFLNILRLHFKNS